MRSLNDMPVWRLVTWNDYKHIFFSHWQVTRAPATPTSTLDEDGEVPSQTTPRASTSLATEEFSARSWQQTSTRLERKRNPSPTHAFDSWLQQGPTEGHEWQSPKYLSVFMNQGNRKRTKTFSFKIQCPKQSKMTTFGTRSISKVPKPMF